MQLVRMPSHLESATLQKLTRTLSLAFSILKVALYAYDVG